MLVTVGHCNTSAMNVSVLRLVFEPAHGERLRPPRAVFPRPDPLARQPIAEMVKHDGDDFIFTCKESSHKALYDFMAGAEPKRHQEKFRKGKATETRRYRWFEDVPLRDGEDAMHVNWIGM